MSTPIELIQAVEARGGRLSVEDEYLVIDPRKAGEPLMEELRRHKAEIITVILERAALRWRNPFEQWLRLECALRPRDFGGLNCLHRSFSAWAGEQDGATCSRDVFERLLKEHDFVFAGVCGVVLVAGLMLREDVESVVRFQREALQ